MTSWRSALGATIVWVSCAAVGALASSLSGAVHAANGRCPAEMVLVEDYCVDRHETTLVDQQTGFELSPFYPPERRMLRFVHDQWSLLRFSVGPDPVRAMPLPVLSDFQRERETTPLAKSRAGRVPHGYLSYYSAKRACEAAGKRLCTDAEWEKACRGQDNTDFPYGSSYRATACNVGSQLHPAAILHGLSSSGHLDPRLNLLMIAGDAPVLRVTGESQACASRWANDAIYDMVGNLDEWVEDPRGVFRGGFYARRTTRGCSAKIESHSATYFDYSTGARCCKNAR